MDKKKPNSEESKSKRNYKINFTIRSDLLQDNDERNFIISSSQANSLDLSLSAEGDIFTLSDVSSEPSAQFISSEEGQNNSINIPELDEETLKTIEVDDEKGIIINIDDLQFNFDQLEISDEDLNDLISDEEKEEIKQRVESEITEEEIEKELNKLENEKISIEAGMETETETEIKNIKEEKEHQLKEISNLHEILKPLLNCAKISYSPIDWNEIEDNIKEAQKRNSELDEDIQKANQTKTKYENENLQIISERNETELNNQNLEVQNCTDGIFSLIDGLNEQFSTMRHELIPNNLSSTEKLQKVYQTTLSATTKLSMFSFFDYLLNHQSV